MNPSSRNEKGRSEALKYKLDGLTYRAIAAKLGVSQQRVQQWLSPPRAVRLIVFDRAHGRCQECGIKVGYSGHVHHMGHNDAEEFNDIANLQLLCPSCHRLAHENMVATIQGTRTIESLSPDDRLNCPICGIPMKVNKRIERMAVPRVGWICTKCGKTKTTKTVTIKQEGK